MPKPKNIFYTIQEIAETLQLSERTIYRYIDEGVLKAYSFKGNYRIEDKDFQTFLCNAQQATVCSRSVPALRKGTKTRLRGKMAQKKTTKKRLKP